jgi:Tol biopolymer transport system component
MAFVRFRKTAKLIVANADATGQTSVLTTKDLSSPWQLSGYVAWSPDGLDLVIALNNAKTGNLNLFVIGTDGSGLTRLSGRDQYDFAPVWSNDGSTIAFVGYGAGGTPRLMLMNPDGTNRREVPIGGPAKRAFTPDWAPDDSDIVFARYDGTSTDLYTVQPDGSGLTQITDTPRMFEGAPAFSPDGSLIVYTRSSHTLETDLWSIPSAGGSPTRLTDTPRSELDPAWQPI